MKILPSEKSSRLNVCNCQSFAYKGLGLVELSPKHWLNYLFSQTAGQVYWLANTSALFAIAGWICLDGLFPRTAMEVGKIVQGWPDTVSPLLAWRVYSLFGILVAGAIGIVGILLTLVIGDRAYRGIRSWLLAMLLLASWLTLLLQWPALAWRAQAWRIVANIPEFQILATALLEDWPENDSTFPELGQFMAFPNGKPRTLIFVTSPTVPGTNSEIRTVELSNEQDLHFQLVGNEEGAWLIHSVNASEPTAFFSGLSGEYTPIRFQTLGNGWFLVEYSFAQLWNDSRN